MIADGLFASNLHGNVDGGNNPAEALMPRKKGHAVGVSLGDLLIADREPLGQRKPVCRFSAR